MVTGIFIFPGKEAIVIFSYAQWEDVFRPRVRARAPVAFLSRIRLLLWQDMQRLYPEEYRESNNVGSSGVVHGFVTLLPPTKEQLKSPHCCFRGI